MNNRRFVSVQFCDDVRTEVGNKFSLMGCYGPSMLLTAFPTVLPKLCVQVKAHTRIEHPFANLSFKLLRGTEVLAEAAVPTDALSTALEAERPSGSKWLIVSALLVMSPFAIEEPSELQVEVESEEGAMATNPGIFRIERAPVAQ